ncbi:hypothetical protein MXL58_22860 [Enterobacter quasiroggenkampii]|uniref:hypothetical protein n=1 Tax=Enterobacter quasiroggenkampii TaxID=2497436 RepID=UPI002DBEF473|nr:hypothetical protein [Enterobacter quasiroggenkampii]MEB6579965.1 hypothetical protein [Enterobacter quasiroggenkampii]
METAFFDNDEYGMQMVYAICSRYRYLDSVNQRKSIVEDIRPLVYVHPRPDSFVSFLTEELSRRGRKYLWDQQNWQNDLNLLIRDLKELLIIRRISEEVHLTLDEKFRQESLAQTDGRFLKVLLTYAPSVPAECVALQLARYISASPQDPRSATADVMTMIFRHLPYLETLKESFLLDPELRKRYCHPDKDPRLSYAQYLADMLQSHL